jgi:precorrin-6B methylase 2
VIDYHRSLIADELRTTAYRRAIARTVRPGDVVLDIGCGSGILSFFACEAGAAKVYAVDRGGMAGIAQFLSRHLGLRERVTVLRDESTAIELPQRADVLVTETMGPLGLDENILGSVLDARKRLLRPDARIIPERIVLTMVPVEARELHDKHVAWFNEPRHGLDLTPLRTFASNSLLFYSLPAEARLAVPATMVDVDLTTFDTTLAEGRTTFTATRAGLVHGFALWFTAALCGDITLSNEIHGATDWAQGFFPLEHPLAVTPGTRITLDLESEDGKAWHWRGKVGRERFDQTTLFSVAPYGP